MAERAVVLGASIGGLLAARVLAEEFDQVTVIERDVLPSGPEHRRGVPQGRHVHALLPRGAAVLDELFPGLLNALVAGGMPVVRHTSELYIVTSGHEITRQPQPLDPPEYMPSRPFLESAVRMRVAALRGVEILDGRDVVGLVADASRQRVTGVRVLRRSHGSAEEELPADLVIDAMGRGGRTPAWLTEWGYERAPETRVSVGLMYASQRLRLPPDAHVPLQLIVGPVPGRPTGMGLFTCEDATIFTVAGYRGHHPPTDPHAMVHFVAGMVPPPIVEALRDAEPISDVATHQFPASQWRRYDRLARFPAGLLTFGDAICSFNPLYGQGMTVAAMQAEALRTCLRQHRNGRLTRQFFRAATRPIGVAWQLATGSDLALPEVDGTLSVPARALNGYVERLMLAATGDAVLSRQFYRVASLLDPPARLFRPSIALRVWRGGRRDAGVQHRAPTAA